MSTTTFVSGASGYIAQHLIKLLLSQNYKVVGTVRSESKGKNLEKLFNNKNFTYEIVADILEDGAFDKALEKHPEVTIVFHAASPFVLDIKDIESELIQPAVKGTKNMLYSIKAHGKNVERLVLTSSYVAAGVFPGADYQDLVINEDSWSTITPEQSHLNIFLGYSASKAYAEKAAWDFIEAEKPTYKFSVVNPSYVFGPQAFDSEVKDTLNTSAEILNQYLKLKPTDPLPETTGAFCDVRDVARAHLVAAEKEEAVNQRLLLVAEKFNPQLIANILRRDFPTLRDNIPEGKPEVAEEQLKSTANGIIENSRTKKILGFTEIGLVQSIHDTINQIIA